MSWNKPRCRREIHRGEHSERTATTVVPFARRLARNGRCACADSSLDEVQRLDSEVGSRRRVGAVWARTEEIVEARPEHTADYLSQLTWEALAGLAGVHLRRTQGILRTNAKLWYLVNVRDGMLTNLDYLDSTSDAVTHRSDSVSEVEGVGWEVSTDFMLGGSGISTKCSCGLLHGYGEDQHDAEVDPDRGPLARQRGRQCHLQCVSAVTSPSRRVPRRAHVIDEKSAPP